MCYYYLCLCKFKYCIVLHVMQILYQTHHTLKEDSLVEVIARFEGHLECLAPVAGWESILYLLG